MDFPFVMVLLLMSRVLNMGHVFNKITAVVMTFTMVTNVNILLVMVKMNQIRPCVHRMVSVVLQKAVIVIHAFGVQIANTFYVTLKHQMHVTYKDNVPLLIPVYVTPLILDQNVNIHSVLAFLRMTVKCVDNKVSVRFQIPVNVIQHILVQIVKYHFVMTLAKMKVMFVQDMVSVTHLIIAHVLVDLQGIRVNNPSVTPYVQAIHPYVHLMVPVST
mmetsp:Transcript_12655/g.18992  ORF Transcript_12655/g.18992 Transcript_12655/m.18992 type:complete len:216 (+) Transcript_12655:2531-3178(+)